MGGRAVVALEPDDLRAGKILLEAQDVVDLGAAPAIDRLVVVADAADVRRAFAGSAARGACASRARQRQAACASEPQPQVLRDVGVLVLVDQDVFEAALVLRSTSGCSRKMRMVCSSRSPKSQAFSVFSRVLIGGVELAALAVGEGRGFALRHLRRASRPLFFQPSISAASRRGRPALLVEAFGLRSAA